MSNHFQRASGASLAEWAMQPGCVHPKRLGKILKDLRFHPTEVSQDILFTFLPALQEMTQEQLDEITVESSTEKSDEDDCRLHDDSLCSNGANSKRAVGSCRDLL